MPISLRTLCLVTLVLCNIHGSLEHEIPRRSFLSRRAIDGTRGRKYFDPEEDGAFDSYGSAGGQYDPFEEKTDLSDIRRNVPGEPGIDYPAYTALPQTGFTCEGRSRGYYADVVAGCQVFHVCHDVLVSSFLCPIGSIFSQKLLTCDWWAKVDCSATDKYTDVNRNSYQQDDDEMIRNAYAMTSLQSGTDVTEDGLVDPDRIGSLVDYQRGPGAIVDFSRVDSVGNDLKNSFESYVRAAAKDFLPMFKQFKERKPESGLNYQEKFFPPQKFQPPFPDSPIIRIQKIMQEQDRKKKFQEDHRGPNEFGSQFQPSYAPTVPTVTTTTRRFYSPTVPTPFKASTVAYDKFDQLIDGSDYFFSRSRSKSFVTPPTRIFSADDKLRGSLDSSKRTDGLSGKVNGEDGEDRTERTEHRFEVRVPDDFRLNRTEEHLARDSLFQERFPSYGEGGEDYENMEDIETRGSIGLGHALRGISVRQQNPVNDKAKEESNSEVAGVFKPNSSRHSFNYGEEGTRRYQHTLARPASTASFDADRKETIEEYQRDDRAEGFDAVTSLFEDVRSDLDALFPTTTPSVVESTIKASTIPKEASNLPDRSLEKNSTNLNSKSLQVDRVEFLKAPEAGRAKFQINVPDLSDVPSLLIRYSTMGDGLHSGTTEIPKFHSTLADDYTHQTTSYDETVGVTDNYDNEEVAGHVRSQNYPTTEGHLGPNDHRKETSLPPNKTKHSESYHVKELEPSSEVAVPNATNLSCLQERGKHCEKSVKGNPAGVSDPLFANSFEKAIDEVALSPSSLESTIIDTPYEIKPPGANGETLKPPDSVAQRVNVETSESASKTVTHRSVEESSKMSKETGKKGDSIEATTANSLIRLIGPETSEHVEGTVERNDSPYQVTLTVNRDEKLVAGDSITRLISQQGKDSSRQSAPVGQLEIVESVEPEIQATERPSPVDIFESAPKGLRNSTTADSRRQTFGTVSLLQLMTELLKLDRAPRPFSLARSKPTNPPHVADDVTSTTQSLRDRKPMTDPSADKDSDEKASTRSVGSTSVLSKEQILGQLADNLGEPQYKTSLEPFLQLPARERTVDFRTGLDLKGPDTDNAQTESSTAVRTTTEVPVTTTATSKSTLTTESARTVVKTEFVPSISFSLNTDEGREEYVEAVLGGLIDSQPIESEKKETTVLGATEKLASRRNETSGEI